MCDLPDDNDDDDLWRSKRAANVTFYLWNCTVTLCVSLVIVRYVTGDLLSLVNV